MRSQKSTSPDAIGKSATWDTGDLTSIRVPTPQTLS